MESMEGADIGQSGGGGKKRDGMEIEIISVGREACSNRMMGGGVAPLISAKLN